MLRSWLGVECPSLRLMLKKSRVSTRSCVFSGSRAVTPLVVSPHTRRSPPLSTDLCCYSFCSEVDVLGIYYPKMHGVAWNTRSRKNICDVLVPYRRCTMGCSQKIQQDFAVVGDPVKHCSEVYLGVFRQRSHILVHLSEFCPIFGLSTKCKAPFRSVSWCSGGWR